MVICKFFQSGYCKFGNRCRNEHPSGGNNRNQPANGFAVLGANNQNATTNKYNISSEVIEKDLTTEAPQWILSAYAPGKDAPEQLFGGYPREQSFEELRLHYVMGKASGNEQQALSEAQELWSNAQQQMQNAARNSRDAMQFINGAENRHPNRHDICQQGTQGAPFGEFLVGKRPNALVQTSATQQQNPFGGGSNNNASPFGAGNAAAPAGGSAFGLPSALGQRPNPFGSSPFGQPSQPTSSLAQPAANAQGASPFGQPSQPTSAFGLPSALGAKPSPFGGSSGFAQASNSGGSGFGETSQLGQKPNPFGAPTTNTNSFASLGSNNTNNNTNAPANPFGAPSNNTNQAGSPFGTANNNQNNNASPSPFGQPSAGPSPFAQQGAANNANPFASATQGQAPGASNPFGQPQQPNGFASQGGQQQNNSPFGAPSTSSPFSQGANAAAAPGANPFAAAQAPKPAAPAGSPYPPGSSKQHPPIESYASKGMDGRLSTFKGKSVIYKDDKPGIREFDGTWRRIWFPDGPPGYSKDTELPPERYDEKSKAQWAAFAQTGRFQDNLMPELPPPRECTVWDF